jgi:predicted dehydrogenase
MAKDKYRVCIVGTGARGNAHAKAWTASGEAKVVAVVDVLEDRAQELAAAYDAPHVFTDYKEAIERDDIDVVSICTPAFYHEEVTIFAAEHGKHMLSEKPIAMRLDQADRMIAVLNETGVVFVINFQSRFGDAPAAVQQCLRDEALGGPLMFRMHSATHIRPKLAMHDMDRGNGGPLNDFMTHYFDYWRWLTGTDPVRVSAQGFTFAKDRPEIAHFANKAPDTATVALEYGSGDLAAFSISWGLPPGVLPQGRIDDILGPQGALAPSRPTTGFKILREGGSIEEFGPYTADTQLLLTQHAIRAIRGEEQVQASAEDARIALAVTWAIYESLEHNGNAVDIVS